MSWTPTMWELTLKLFGKTIQLDEENFRHTLERDDWGSKGRIDTLRDNHSPRNNQSLRDDQSHRDDQTPKGWSVLTKDDPIKDHQAQQSPVLGPTILNVKTTHHLGFPTNIWGPSLHPYKEITCTLRPKILSHNQISYIWKCDPKYLGTFLSTRKFPQIKGF